MFYVLEEIKMAMVCHNIVPLSHIRSTVSDGVSQSPKGEGRSRLAPPPLNLPLMATRHLRHCEILQGKAST